jgi:hypothetical protein
VEGACHRNHLSLFLSLYREITMGDQIEKRRYLSTT